MPRRQLHMTGTDGTPLRASLRALRIRLDVPAGFPAAVLAEAAEAARAPDVSGHLDATAAVPDHRPAVRHRSRPGPVPGAAAATAEVPPPEWVLRALPGLPREMAEGGRRASTVERECVDLVEAALLGSRVGESFDGGS